MGDKERIAELEAALRKIDEALHSHIDGRDYLEELGPAGWSYCDAIVRRDGRELRFEADWIKSLWYAMKPARQLLSDKP